MRQRWDEGVHNIQQIWREIKAQGYPHSDRALRAHLEALRGKQQADLPAASLLDHFSAKAAVWLFMRPFDELKENEREELLTILQTSSMAEMSTPVQKPRIPVWVVGVWPYMKSMRRVLAWDGVIPSRQGDDGSFFAKMTPADLQAMQTFFAEQRTGTMPFDIVVEGETPGDDPEQARSIVRPQADVGVTWWLEAVYGTPETQGGVEGMRARIRQGPPRL